MKSEIKQQWVDAMTKFLGPKSVVNDKPKIELWMNGILTGGRDCYMGTYEGNDAHEAYKTYVKENYGGILPAYAHNDNPRVWGFNPR